MRQTNGREPIPWLWIGGGFVVTLLSLWLAVWLVSFFLTRDPLPVDALPPATIMRLTAPATAEPTPTGVLPTPTGIPTLTPPPTPNRGVAPDEITRGFFARVVNTDGIGVSIRAGSGTTNEILAVAPEGADLLVLDGPVDNGGFRWWQVEQADGTRGWAVELFLQPVPQPPDWPGG